MKDVDNNLQHRCGKKWKKICFTLNKNWSKVKLMIIEQNYEARVLKKKTPENLKA